MSERRFMIGTEGNPDYLVISTHEGIDIGVKGIADMVAVGDTLTGEMIIGARIRMMKAEGSTILNLGHLITQRYPKFPFQKVDEVRGSTVIGSRISPHYINENWEEFTEFLVKSIMPGIMSCLHYLKDCGATIEYTPEEVQEFLVESWKEGYSVYMHIAHNLEDVEQDPQPTPPKKENPTGGNVIPFPGTKKDTLH